MYDENPVPQEQGQSVANSAPPAPDSQPGSLPFFQIPPPPIPGKTAWSLNPWLPE